MGVAGALVVRPGSPTASAATSGRGYNRHRRMKAYFTAPIVSPRTKCR
jgi:hypothetical protein